MFSLSLTCLVAFRWRYVAALFLSLHDGRLNPGVVPRPEIPGFPSKIHLPSNTNTIPIPVPRKLPAFQGYSRQYRYTTRKIVPGKYGTERADTTQMVFILQGMLMGGQR